MNKKELVEAMANKSGLTQADSEKSLSAFQECITETLSKGDSVALVGFGTFEVIEKKERTGRNPATREPMTIPASKAPKFKIGKKLKDAVKSLS